LLPLLDLGFDSDGLCFLVRPVTVGTTLGDLLYSWRNGPPPGTVWFELPRLVHAIHAASTAVVYAHSQGIRSEELSTFDILLGSWPEEVFVLGWNRCCEHPPEWLVRSIEWFAFEEAYDNLASTSSLDVYLLGGILYCLLYTGPRNARDSSPGSIWQFLHR